MTQPTEIYRNGELVASYGEWTPEELLEQQREQYGSPEALLTAVIGAIVATRDVEDPPEYVQPTGAHDAYLPGAVVRYNGARWRNDLGAVNVWPPGTMNAGWTPLDQPEPDPSEPQPWVQPVGGHDAYPAGAIVTHNGQVWQSTVDGNVWAPGVYGWVVVP